MMIGLPHVHQRTAQRPLFQAVHVSRDQNDITRSAALGTFDPGEVRVQIKRRVYGIKRSFGLAGRGLDRRSGQVRRHQRAAGGQ